MSDKKKKAYGSGRFPLGGFFCACMGTVALALLVILIMKTDYEADRPAGISGSISSTPRRSWATNTERPARFPSAWWTAISAWTWIFPFAVSANTAIA